LTGLTAVGASYDAAQAYRGWDDAMLMRSARAAQRGFTLLELMIVVAIVAILAAWAISSYSTYIRKARRADAQQQIQQIALKQEQYRAEHPEYADDWGELGYEDPDTADADGTGAHFDWEMSSADAGSFTITATATGDQAKDKVGATACSPLTVDEDGQSSRSPAECWAR
jgi:type IV pilus assembly protein PilE